MDISSRIKLIVEPYEKKIRDLEEQLLQKDFEITVLKEKLFNAENNPSNCNQMGMGIGLEPPFMNINNMKYNNFQEEKESDIIKLEFRFNDINQKIVQRCFNDDEFGFVQKKVLKKLNVAGEIKFIFNAKNTDPKATVSELGMINGAVIFVVSIKGSNNGRISLKEIKKEEEFPSSSKINIIFHTTQGTRHSIFFDENISIGLAIQKYLKRVGRGDIINSVPKDLVFLYNAQQYKPSDTIKLKDLFGENKMPKIVINDIGNIIGA